jgi:uncharacterized membrane protein
MTWSQRYRVRSFLKNSIWFIPFLSILFAIGLVRLISLIESAVGWQGTFSVEGDRAIFTAMASSMLTFIVLVFSMLLVVVQLASAQLSPRIIATAFRDRVTKFALTVFVFTFTFSLALVRRIDASVPPISELVATFSNVVAVGVYLYLIDHVGQMLRPVSFISRVATEGRAVIETIYPRRLGERGEEQARAADLPPGSPSDTVEHSGDGVFLAFDETGLIELARRTDCVIELVPQVGDFVAKGSALFRLHGGGRLDENELQQKVAFGPERTLEQDPAFAFRIIVDIASKALSSAINDPTTAVLALDQLQYLLRSVGSRDLDTGQLCDATGQLRLVYRTPDWEDFVDLAVTEIRHYGKDSIQVARRMRAMLEDLMKTVSPRRAERLQQELDLLHRSIERSFFEPADRVRADTSDSQGMGGTRQV